MLISLPHNVSVNIRPRGVSFPNDEAVSGDNSQTDAEAGLKRRAEVVQPEFEVFLLLQGDVWVGRFRENFLHHDTDDRPYGVSLPAAMRRSSSTRCKAASSTIRRWRRSP